MPVEPTAEELQASRDWFEASFNVGACPPLSFHYGEATAPDCLMAWPATQTEEKEPGALRHVLTWTDPATGLEICVEARCFAAFPAVEWLVRLTNRGRLPTPLLRDIRPLDAFWPDFGPHSLLHWAHGSECALDDFAPRCATFYSPPHRTIGSFQGRSSEQALPFFNLQDGAHGIIGAIGWTGSWQADFIREGDGMRLRAGMPKTHLRLHPGESIRTPRLLLLFWRGERIRAHNLWRRLLLTQYVLQQEGAPLRGPLCFAVWGENTAERQIAKARWWKQHKLPLEYFWIDAGWYGSAPQDPDAAEGPTVFNSQWWRYVGDWRPNATLYPEGLGPIGRALQELGLGFILWVEPERVFRETPWTQQHPEWLLGPIGDNYLFNLGLPEARAALTDLLSALIEEAGVTCYRQDFNMSPTPFWEAADAPERIGISEIRHIEGLYALWDELRQRHPGLIIDNCSSGGRRIDLETISRSLPLWRSDYQCFPGFDPVGIQGQTHGLSLWVPLSAGVCDHFDAYAFRSALSPALVMTTNLFEREPFDFAPPDQLRRRMHEYLRLRPYFYGDFYPLLPYSLDNAGWALWQFDRPDLGEGCVIAFRRPESPLRTMLIRLQGLNTAAVYALEDFDRGVLGEYTGAALADGLSVCLPEPRSAKILVYRKR